VAQGSEKPGFGWGSLAEAGVFTLVVAGAATMVFVIRGFDPALAVDLVLMLVGLSLINRDRRSGVIVLLIATIIFLVFGGFFAVQVLPVPRSTTYFLLNVVYIVVGLATLIASIALMRSGRSPNATARRVAIGMAVVIGGMVLVAGALRLTYDEPSLASGEIGLRAEDNEFEPTRLAGSGETVTIVIDNRDQALHTFSIDNLGVDEDLPGGLRSQVTFKAEPGTYVYYCQIFGHDDMKGKLIVR
jgi:plastocyanin